MEVLTRPPGIRHSLQWDCRRPSAVLPCWSVTTISVHTDCRLSCGTRTLRRVAGAALMVSGRRKMCQADQGHVRGRTRCRSGESLQRCRNSTVNGHSAQTGLPDWPPSLAAACALAAGCALAAACAFAGQPCVVSVQSGCAGSTGLVSIRGHVQGPSAVSALKQSAGVLTRTGRAGYDVLLSGIRGTSGNS